MNHTVTECWAYVTQPSGDGSIQTGQRLPENAKISLHRLNVRNRVKVKLVIRSCVNRFPLFGFPKVTLTYLNDLIVFYLWCVVLWHVAAAVVHYSHL